MVTVLALGRSRHTTGATIDITGADYVRQERKSVRFSRLLHVVDAHAAGESGKVVGGGVTDDGGILLNWLWDSRAAVHPCQRVPSANLACQRGEAGFVVRDLRYAALMPGLLRERLLQEKHCEPAAFLRRVLAGADGDDVRVVVLPGEAGG
jgi:hypothetical protein